MFHDHSSRFSLVYQLTHYIVNWVTTWNTYIYIEEGLQVVNCLIDKRYIILLLLLLFNYK